MKNRLSQIFYQFLQYLEKGQGLHFFNRYIPEHKTDWLTEKVKSVLWIGVIISLFAMVLNPHGFLYATFLRPIILNFLLLNRVHLEPRFIMTPESGMHWLTITIYFLITYKAIEYWEKQNIEMILHKNLYNFALMMMTLFVPFEFIYLTLYDIYHNIPVYGYALFRNYGWWMEFPYNIIKTLWFIDGFFTLGGLYVIYYIGKEVKERYPVKIVNFDKYTKIFLIGYILTTLLWIAMPLYTEVNFQYGTKYFPQTIYPEYDYYENRNMTHPDNETYGIVNEIWVPNDLVKIWNHSSKAFSVLFMYSLLTPRRKDF